MTLSQAAEALLERVLTGDADPEADEVQAMIGREPEFRERLADARRVLRSLDAAGRFEAESLAEAAGVGEAAGESTFVRALIANAEESPQPTARAWTRRAAVGAVAAALVLFLSLRWMSGSDGDGTLGFELQPIQPVGSGSSWERFEWRSDDGGGVEFVVTVYAANAAADDEAIARSPRVETLWWEPDESGLAGWPNEILWEVSAYDRGGRWLGTSTATRAAR